MEHPGNSLSRPNRTLTFERTLAALLRQGLIAQAGDMAGTDQIERLIITSAGLAALGIEPDTASKPNSMKETATNTAAAAVLPAIRPDGKMGIMLDMVSDPNGATIVELAEQAGWLPHTTRAALTRLRQRGFDIQSVGG